MTERAEKNTIPNHGFYILGVSIECNSWERRNKQGEPNKCCKVMVGREFLGQSRFPYEWKQF